MPHTVAVLPYLDELTDKARKIGAVNTIRVDTDGRLIGGNTDGAGFLADLGEQKVDCQRQPALVLGAGGAARAVAYTLAEHGCPEITIVNRTESKARQLVHELSCLFPDLAIAAHPWVDRVGAAHVNSLLINCTNVGMNEVCTPSGSPSPWPNGAPLFKTQRIIDLVYTPRVTPLLQRAMKEGLQTISGVGMLVHQAALSFAWWAESAPPIDAMHAAIASSANLR
jgi:shikimate dehydrogenase